MSRLSRPAWLTTGLLIGAILIPTVAFAATTFTSVHITAADRTANVSAGGQLRTVEMDPANFVHGTALSTGGCVPLAVAPAGRALVIKQINVDAETRSGAGAFAVIHSDPTCGHIVSIVDFSQNGVTSLPLGTGIPVRAGTGLYMRTDGAATVAQGEAFGYSLGASAIPASITARQHIGMTPEALARTRTR